MANSGIGNTLGAVQLDSFEPKQMTFYARGAISGGALVFASGAADVVGSGTSSYLASDLLVAGAASGGQFTGVAIQSAASGSPIPVALEGVFLLVANGTVTAGTTVVCDGNNAVASATTAGMTIGRALTSATSGTNNYAAVFVRG